MEHDQEREGLEWQIGVWDGMTDVYQREIDRRFVPVVDAVITRAGLSAGQSVLDLGTGTGSVAERAACLVEPGGRVHAVDLSRDMLAAAGRRLRASGSKAVTLHEGRAEEIPLADRSVDVALASLSLMYVIDREIAAREIARVLRPGGRLVGAVWAGPETCDIVRFQQTAGQFGDTPPVPGVGPGALADPGPFLKALDACGIETRVETETLTFDFDDFESAWAALAGVTTAQLPEARRQQAKQAVMAAMYPGGDGPRHFLNETQFLIGTRLAG